MTEGRRLLSQRLASKGRIATGKRCRQTRECALRGRHVGSTRGVRPVSSGSATSWSQESQFAGPGDGLGPAVDFELAVDAAAVPLYRVKGAEQTLADLAVRKSRSDQPQHLQLAVAEGVVEGLVRGGSLRDLALGSPVILACERGQ